MRSRRHWPTCALIALPTLVMCALGVFFLIDKVPEIEKLESDRVKAVYRETALEIKEKDAGERGADAGDAFKGMKPAGKMAPGKWGYSPIPSEGRTHVWYSEGDRTWSVVTPYEPPRRIGTVITFGGASVMMVLVIITIACIKCFLRYMNERDDFLAATAHDLTTPLVGLRLVIGRSDDEARRLVDRLLLIVGNIKDFLKLGGRRSPASVSFDLVACAREAYTLFAADYADLESGDVVFEGDGRAVARADETMTLQILWNLFGNDLKYAAPYGRVRVRVAQTDDAVELRLADEGPGLSPRDRRRAFDRYYRAKTVLESGKGGFGIGLCTAREFARMMGGDLTVGPNEPKGCIFTLRLPKGEEVE